MSIKHFLYCKKNYNSLNLRGDILGGFEKGERYYYYSNESQIEPVVDIFVYYDEENIETDRQGYRFYYNVEDGDSIYYLKVFDYFYTKQEERKLKLEKLKNV